MEEATGKSARRLGMAMRHARLARRWSQEEVAHRADLGPSYYGQCERGERNVSLETLLHICRALEVQPSGLLKSAGL